MPWIDPGASDARWAIACGGCAPAAVRPPAKSTRTPTAARASNLVVRVIVVSPGLLCGACCGIRPVPLLRIHRKSHVPGQALVRNLVGNLHLEPVLALGERRQRHSLSALKLVPGGEIEFRRQGLRIQVLRVGLVEELFSGLASLAG